jgi:hypothetical protein
MKTMLANTNLNMMMRLLFNKKYFSTKYSPIEECEKFSDLLEKQ